MHQEVNYRCTLADGTGTAGPYLTPFVNAWASAQGLTLEPGTLNLCADREPDLPTDFISLRPWDYALTLQFRKHQLGYDPRLYELILEGAQGAWMFRWSDLQHLHNFVGDTRTCLGRRHCEIVAEVNLTRLWNLTAASVVTLNFA